MIIFRIASKLYRQRQECSKKATTRDLARLCVDPQKEEIGWKTGVLRIRLDYSVRCIRREIRVKTLVSFFFPTELFIHVTNSFYWYWDRFGADVFDPPKVDMPSDTLDEVMHYLKVSNSNVLIFVQIHVLTAL